MHSEANSTYADGTDVGINVHLSCSFALFVAFYSVTSPIFYVKGNGIANFTQKSTLITTKLKYNSN